MLSGVWSLRFVLAALLSICGLSGLAGAQDYRPHPDSFLRTANHTLPELSPEGRYLAIVDYSSEASAGGDLVIYDLDSPQRETVSRTDLTGYNVHYLIWANEQRLLVVVETVGYVEFRGRRVSVPVFRTLSFDPYDTSRPVVLFQNERRNVFRNVNNAFWSTVTDLLEEDPAHVLIPAFRGDNLDLWRVNVFTGDATNIERGNDNTRHWFTGPTGEAVMRVDVFSQGRRYTAFTRAPGERSWRRTANYLTNELADAPPEFAFAGHGEDAESIFIFGRPEGEDTVGIYPFNLVRSEYGVMLGGAPGIDITQSIIDSRTRRLLGYVRSDRRHSVEIIDPELAAVYADIRREFPDDALIIPDDFRGSRMLFYVSSPDEPGAMYLYDSRRNEMMLLRSLRPSLANRRLAEVEIVEYTARDGLELFAYLTLPPRGAGPQTPLLVLPHGGPEARDVYGFDLLAQFYANSGYAVLQPMFRGSAGFGRQFAEAGYGEWGGVMQTDVEDALAHIVSQGRADPERVCIGGFSYGGYAALMGGAMTPELYQCVFAAAPVTDLASFVRHWQREDDAAGEYWEMSIGHPRRDRDRLAAMSPTQLADRLTMPVFLAHGGEDEIVPFEQSELLAEALADAGVVHDFAIYDRADHSFSRRLDMRSVLTLTRQLLDRTIGPDRGRYDNVFSEGPPDRSGQIEATTTSGASAEPK
jgi:dipeptidyl aminopeptidase/acylaminoacyl peptidase